ncbi:Uncharacterised protein [Vibrio cholerae]|uniref:Uncharacterized protein n=1 Tax=Vibrio cholerae TaxID=666 RepID=A0A655ZNS0_VIBCL|nr:Uncharacterised protein [Vibrio cholerae]
MITTDRDQTAPHRRQVVNRLAESGCDGEINISAYRFRANRDAQYRATVLLTNNAIGRGIITENHWLAGRGNVLVQLGKQRG